VIPTPDSDRLRSGLSTAFDLATVVVVIAVVVPFAIHAMPGLIGANHSFVVLSGSMEPTISPGDVVVVEEVPPGEIERGDVITYAEGRAGTPPTTHRVVEIRRTEAGPRFVTQGDANEEPDPSAIEADRVIGARSLVIPYVGHVIRFANTTTGFLALVIAPLGLLMLSELRSVLREGTGGDDGDGDGGDGGANGPPAPVKRTVAAPVGATDGAATATAGADASDDASLTLTGTDVRLTVGVLVLVTPYTGYVAYQLRTAWALTAAFAAGCLFLFALAVLLTVGDGEDASTTEPAVVDAPGAFPDAEARVADRADPEGGDD
jgi:signal peptidase